MRDSTISRLSLMCGFKYLPTSLTNSRTMSQIGLTHPMNRSSTANVNLTKLIKKSPRNKTTTPRITMVLANTSIEVATIKANSIDKRKFASTTISRDRKDRNLSFQV